MKNSVIGVTLLTAEEVNRFSSKIGKNFYCCWGTHSCGSACIVCPDGKIDHTHSVDYTPIKIFPVLKLQTPNKGLENFKVNCYDFISISPELAICKQDVFTISYSRFAALLEKKELQKELEKWYEEAIKPFLDN